MKKIEIIGSRYGKLQVLSEHSKTRNGHIRYSCVCDCGNTCNILLTHLRQGNTKSCGCDKKRRADHKLWTGVGEMSGDFWYNHIVRSASGTKSKRGKIELSITKEYVWKLFLKQSRRCALSGIELSFPKASNDNTYTASLDRVDSGRGYVEGNVQWVHKDVNIMKNRFNNQYFIKMCSLISGNSCEISRA